MKYYIEGRFTTPDGTLVSEHREPVKIQTRWAALKTYRDFVATFLSVGFETVETGPLWSTYRMTGTGNPNLLRIALGVSDVR